MRFIQGDLLLSPNGELIPQALVVTQNDGTIEQVITNNQIAEVDPLRIERYRGVLTPGFVNTHCHLELSHLKGCVPQHTGLPGFIQHLQKIRSASEETITDAANKAQNEMLEQGIVAVGDICNSNHTLQTKAADKLHYHNFIEVFSFREDAAGRALEQGKELESAFHLNGMTNGSKTHRFTSSIVPHAPYSCSFSLIKNIMEYHASKPQAGPLTMHIEECEEEIEMYRQAGGKMMAMLQQFGINTSHWRASGETPLSTMSKWMQSDYNMIWVHHTYSSRESVNMAGQLMPNSFWCLCPSANLYIENQLPSKAHLTDVHARICFGTDSLASNHALSILDEMRIIQQAWQIPLAELLQWATLHGAQALCFDHILGSIERGKKPGLNIIGQLDQQLQITESTSVTALKFA